MTTSPSVSVSLNFMPAFYHEHLGLTYGKPYYFDARYRADVDRAENRFLHEILGRFGVGSREPSPSPVLSIQPIDLVKLTQGAELHCPPAATLETWGHPWAGLGLDDIERIDPDAAARHPIVDTLLRQYGEMRTLYGERADIFGIKAGQMITHTPYTTAHQLCGGELFLLLMDEPDKVQRVFAKVWAIYRAIFTRLAAALQAPFPGRVHLGDCSASLLSPAVYRTAVLPANRAIALEFAAVGYHSCGASSHLLTAFAQIPNVTGVELGPGTDIRAAVELLPGVAMRPLIDPILMRDGSPDRIGTLVADTLDAAADARETTLCAWSFDRDTPIRNVETMYETVRDWQRDRPNRI